MISDEQLSDELETLRARFASTKRRRSPVEAAPALNTAYITLLFAVGHARLGNAERARSLETAAREVLDPTGDHAHRWLMAAYAARIELALACAPFDTPLPEVLATEYAGLDRVEVYKIDRLRELSRLLDPVPEVDAVGTFSRQLEIAYRSAGAPRHLGGFLDAAPIDQQIANLEQVPAERRAAVLIECLCAMTEFAEPDVMPIVVRALPLLDRLPAPRSVARATALRIAARFGWGELVPQLVTPLVRELRELPGRVLQSALSQAVRSLRQLGCHAELRELIALGGESTEPRDDLGWIIAGAAAVVGDMPRPLRREPSTLGHWERFELERRLALAFGHAEPAQAIERLHELSQGFAFVTDSHGTNSHFTLMMLCFVDAFVRGFTLLSITRG